MVSKRLLDTPQSPAMARPTNTASFCIFLSVIELTSALHSLLRQWIVFAIKLLRKFYLLVKAMAKEKVSRDSVCLSDSDTNDDEEPDVEGR
ncbi:hypothetical protein E2C01_088098 [Portunus trituberculatus]|uniref:Uncharacterized protein n=1 Tax=Portunus trituberculatus TaxID=210409 RepID=A0A5B7JF17_PORTR|nr:hypothetical protein [Portunus trituberculatus]